MLPFVLNEAPGVSGVTLNRGCALSHIVVHGSSDQCSLGAAAMH
jgi:hypothetical protein